MPSLRDMHALNHSQFIFVLHRAFVSLWFKKITQIQTVKLPFFSNYFFIIFCIEWLPICRPYGTCMLSIIVNPSSYSPGLCVSVVQKNHTNSNRKTSLFSNYFFIIFCIEWLPICRPYGTCMLSIIVNSSSCSTGPLCLCGSKKSHKFKP